MLGFMLFGSLVLIFCDPTFEKTSSQDVLQTVSCQRQSSDKTSYLETCFIFNFASSQNL